MLNRYDHLAATTLNFWAGFIRNGEPQVAQLSLPGGP